MSYCYCYNRDTDSFSYKNISSPLDVPFNVTVLYDTRSGSIGYAVDLVHKNFLPVYKHILNDKTYCKITGEFCLYKICKITTGWRGLKCLFMNAGGQMYIAYIHDFKVRNGFLYIDRENIL